MKYMMMIVDFAVVACTQNPFLSLLTLVLNKCHT